METIYLIIVGFLLILAVFDLFVGVSNDAVNFLNSAIGARVAHFRTILIIAAAGVLVGAMMSAGMMDVARHGIMLPLHFSFHEVMIVFLAVMVTDVIVLDTFNTLGLPTSTTVSLVFELLGAAFVLAVIKIFSGAPFVLSDLINTDKVLTVIIAIFVSVAIALVFGILVQWLTRIIFTFNQKRHNSTVISIFGGISFTILLYFIFIKGISKSPFVEEGAKDWIVANTNILLVAGFVVTTMLSFVLNLCKINIFKIIILTGTFALAMAFAGNDLVNFIGVPLAGLSSYQDWMNNGAGDANSFMMSSLMESAKSPFFYLLAAGLVMIIAITTSKKAQNVVKTSVDLSRQDEGDEMFGSSRAARSLVRATQKSGLFFSRFIPKALTAKIDKRFSKDEISLPDGAAFDVVRAAINLVLSSVLIVIGTNYKLPLSTTYVTFMVAMGTSLADRAWSRESAVFRVTGVMSVIGGWFITAGVSFMACALVCLLMYYGGFVAMFLLMGLAIFLLIRSNIQFGKKKEEEEKDRIFTQMMRSRDPQEIWELLQTHVSKAQTSVCQFVLDQYNHILNGLANENFSELNIVEKELANKQEELKRLRRKEFLSIRRIPRDIAIERNTWFHLGINSNKQYIYCLIRMLEPVKEHVDNHFNPLPESYRIEFQTFQNRINELMIQTTAMLNKKEFEGYKDVLKQADLYKDELSVLRENLIERMHHSEDTSLYNILQVYLNLLQESQELLSIMRHQLRATQKLLAQ